MALKRVRISSHTGNHVHHPYICGIPHAGTNETKSPGVSIAYSLPVCDEVALRRLPRRLHDNCSISYFENFSYEILVVYIFRTEPWTEGIKFGLPDRTRYLNLMHMFYDLRKFHLI